MPKLFHLKFAGSCSTLPQGFWSAVDVWIKKPHVVNKRLCGVKETESRDVSAGELRLFLADDGLHEEVMSLRGSDTHQRDSPWSFSVRTFVPKTNCYGKNLQKEAVLKDVERDQVTFIPFEEDAEGKVSFKKGNIYQIQLSTKATDDWALELHVLTEDGWVSDGMACPNLFWLSSELLPKLVRWATESRSSEFKSTLSLLPVEKYSLMYQHLKEKYKAMVKVWPEVTDPEKFVYEDVAIASYLLVLWAEETAEKNLTARQSFVDLGCGNGLLVHILTNEGNTFCPLKDVMVFISRVVTGRLIDDTGLFKAQHPGKGIDVRRRRIWDMYGPQTVLQEKAITPSETFLFPNTDWLIGNHSDELTPWIPVIAARSSYSCRYFVLPCCFFDFYGKYQRRQSNKSQYKEYIDFITEVSQVCGFNTEEDCMRIPSTKRVCLLGKSRSYQPPDEAEWEQRRTSFIQGRRVSPEVQRSDVEASGDCCHGNADHTSGGTWGAGFQPRDKVERVRNCASLPRDFIDKVVLRVANALLERTGGGSCDDWNQGGSLSLSEAARLLEPEALQLLKKECGGLQTLLKNNYQVFKVEGGVVYIRDWRDATPSKADRRKQITPRARKTRSCWFHDHHPQGCPLHAPNCAFAHGPEELQPSTRPLKKKMKSFIS